MPLAHIFLSPYKHYVYILVLHHTILPIAYIICGGFLAMVVPVFQTGIAWVFNLSNIIHNRKLFSCFWLKKKKTKNLEAFLFNSGEQWWELDWWMDIILISALEIVYGKAHTISPLDMVLVLRLRHKNFPLLFCYLKKLNGIEYIKCFSKIYSDKYVTSLISNVETSLQSPCL